jgi:hypothetical protein
MNKPTTTLCAFMVIAAAAALGATGPAAATTNYNDTSSGGACHAAAGSAEPKFTYANNYLTNISTTDQYVVCHFAMNDSSIPSPLQLTDLVVHTASGSTTGTLICVAQYGAYYSGANHVESTQTQNLPLGAGSYGQVNFSATFTRTQIYNTFTLNCKVPAGFKLGLIEFWQG